MNTTSPLYAYLEKWSTLSKVVVYDFRITAGGIGDLMKFFMSLLNFCIKGDIKLYYLVNNLAIEKFIRLKHDYMYITADEIKGKRVTVTDVKQLIGTDFIKTGAYYVVTPNILYIKYDVAAILPLNYMFYFAPAVIQNAQRLGFAEGFKYVSVHLRMGDKYLETEKKYIFVPNDVRPFAEEKLFKFLETWADIKNILFFSDNMNYKLFIKKKFHKVRITDFAVAHTGLVNTTESGVLDSVTEFYLMTGSEHIVAASKSGFSAMAAKFSGVMITGL